MPQVKRSFERLLSRILKICLDKMSSSSEVTEFNVVEKLSLPAEGVVLVNSNLSAVDNNVISIKSQFPSTRALTRSYGSVGLLDKKFANR